MSGSSNERIWQFLLAIVGIMATTSTAIAAWTCANIVDLRERTARIEERVNAIDRQINRVVADDDVTGVITVSLLTEQRPNTER